MEYQNIAYLKNVVNWLCLHPCKKVTTSGPLQISLFLKFNVVTMNLLLYIIYSFILQLSGDNCFEFLYALHLGYSIGAYLSPARK